MSKPNLSDRGQSVGAPVFFNLNRPSMPVMQKIPDIEKRVSDPSSSQPNGLSYPIPSFFEYRASYSEFEA